MLIVDTAYSTAEAMEYDTADLSMHVDFNP